MALVNPKMAKGVEELMSRIAKEEESHSIDATRYVRSIHPKPEYFKAEWNKRPSTPTPEPKRSEDFGAW
jgi:rubrerythrin